MTGPVYRDALRKSGISWVIPEDSDREIINSIIFKELVYGVFTRDSREYFTSVIQGMKDAGCDGAIMGCTEIPLLLDPAESPLPLLDSTRLLAETAVRESLRT
jgi:aspartate racemase